MKKYMIAVPILTALVVVLLSVSAVGNAQTFRSGDSVSLAQNQVIDSSLFVSGRTVNVSSEVRGDVFCAGQTVVISGVVQGDVICAAQTLNITGKVEGDVRLAGQTVTLASKIEGSATVMAQTLTMASSSLIEGDLSVGASDVILNGAVGRDVAAGAANLTIASQIGRNIEATTENFTLTDTARVQGNIDYTSQNDLTKQGETFVGGTITRSDPPKNQTADSKHGAVFGFSIAWFFFWFLAMLVTALVVVLLIPRYVNDAASQVFAHPIKTPLVGLAATVFMPILILLLAISLIGIPLAIIIALSWIIVLILSGPFFAYTIGRLLLSRNKHAVLRMLVGATILLILYFVPFFGFIALVAATWYGAGMILLELIRRTPRPEYRLGITQKK